MATVVGTVNFILGQAYAIKADGTQRLLMLGDEVYADEVIRTAPDAKIEITMADGQSVALEGGQSWLVSADTYTAAADYPIDEAVINDDVASVEAIQQAILAGVDPTQAAEAPAAGNVAGAAAGENEGSSFVLVERTAAEGNAEAGFDTIGLTATQTAFTVDPEALVINAQEPPVVVNNAPTTDPVTLAAIAEDSGARIITA
ncbi:retention module-containing protein, partial [Neptunomonas antarctica]